MLRKKALLFVLLASVLLGGMVVMLLSYAANQILESNALIVAEIVAGHARASRSVYTKDVVGKLKRDGTGGHQQYDEHPGYVPLPAQFLKRVSHYASIESNNLFFYRSVSKWNIEPTQGLSDEFLQWAWAELEKQDQVLPRFAIKWKPVWRIEEKQGQNFLRYLLADPASSKSCIACHNRYEQMPDIMAQRKLAGVAPGKKWKQHQLLGAISVTVPLSSVEGISGNLIWSATLLLSGFAAVAFFSFILYLGGRRRQKSEITSLTWQSAHDQQTRLYNRRGFKSEMKSRLFQDGRIVGEHVLGIVDLDSFKLVNEKHGHKTGDLLLEFIGKNLAKKLDENILSARLGSDEFAVLWLETSSDRALQAGEDLLTLIRETAVDIDGQAICVSASIGLVLINQGSDSVLHAMQDADQACYIAKEKGGAQVALA